MSITEGITPRQFDYDVDADGRVINLRPAGSEVDLAYYHPDMQLADEAFVPAKEASDRLLDMMLHASDRLPSIPVSHPSAFEWERKAMSEGVWTRLSGGPDGNPSYKLGLDFLTPIPHTGIPLDEPDAGGVNKWRGRSSFSVPA